MTSHYVQNIETISNEVSRFLGSRLGTSDLTVGYLVAFAMIIIVILWFIEKGD